MVMAPENGGRNELSMTPPEPVSTSAFAVAVVATGKPVPSNDPQCCSRSLRSRWFLAPVLTRCRRPALMTLPLMVMVKPSGRTQPGAEVVAVDAGDGAGRHDRATVRPAPVLTSVTLPPPPPPPHVAQVSAGGAAGDQALPAGAGRRR